MTGDYDYLVRLVGRGSRRLRAHPQPVSDAATERGARSFELRGAYGHAHKEPPETKAKRDPARRLRCHRLESRRRAYVSRQAD